MASFLSLGHPMPRWEVSVTWNTKVASLICPTSRCWDISFLHPFLSVEEENATLSINIGDPSRCDRFVWPSTKNGLHVDKSGYHYARSLRGSPVDSRPSSSHSFS